MGNISLQHTPPDIIETVMRLSRSALRLTRSHPPAQVNGVQRGLVVALGQLSAAYPQLTQNTGQEQVPPAVTQAHTAGTTALSHLNNLYRITGTVTPNRETQQAVGLLPRSPTNVARRRSNTVGWFTRRTPTEKILLGTGGAYLFYRFFLKKK